MGIREELNKRPKLVAAMATAAAVIGVGAVALQLSGGGRGSDERAFFTTDEGANWFVGDANQLPPFSYEGKEAVRAHVFECNGKQFVNHLERYTSERRKFMEAAAQARKAGQPLPAPPAAGRQTANWGIEVKKPGDKGWTAGSDLGKSSKVMQAKCPDGKDALPVAP